MKLSNLTLVAVVLANSSTGVYAKNKVRNLKVDEDFVVSKIGSTEQQLMAMIGSMQAKIDAIEAGLTVKLDAVTAKAATNSVEIAANAAQIGAHDDKLYGITTTVAQHVTTEIANHDAQTNPHANSVGEFINSIKNIRYP